MQIPYTKEIKGFYNKKDAPKCNECFEIVITLRLEELRQRLTENQVLWRGFPH